MDLGADLEMLAEGIRKGQCILFLGAGVHSPPPVGARWVYPQEERPPRGRELAVHLAAKSRFTTDYPDEDPRNLERVALYCEASENFGRRWLVNQIREAVQVGKRPSRAVSALAELPFRYIATTNYDHLFEEALTGCGKHPRVVIYSPDRFQQTPDYAGTDFDPTPGEPFMWKVHGDIDVPESMVISDEDYIKFILRLSDREPFAPVPISFRWAFSRYATLFVGYSLLDYKPRLLFQTLRWNLDRARMPSNFAVDISPDLLVRNIYDHEHRLVRYIAADVWSFVPALYAAVMGREMS